MVASFCLPPSKTRLGIAARLAPLIADPRNPAFVTHSVADILRARMLAIACGYEDGDDHDHLRTDPGFKLACGRLPDSGRDLCSQPTVSRWENAPDLREVMRLTYAMIDPLLRQLSASAPRRDTGYRRYRRRRAWASSSFRCSTRITTSAGFLPIHVYDTAASRPVAMLLRPGTTPSGAEVRNHLRRLVRRIRHHWPNTRLTIRGDGHYGRPEVMAWCEANGVDYILGLPGNKVLDRLVEPAADDVRVRRAEAQAPVLRRYTEARYGAKSWRCERRVAVRIEATTKGLDIRFVVTNIKGGSAEWLYDTLYCARGQAENLIKLHKSQLASDRTSCRSPLANQMRLVLHTGAFWLMLGLRDTIPKPQPLAQAEFITLRMRLIKIGARIAETASRVRIAFAAAHPEAALFASLARCLHPAGP